MSPSKGLYVLKKKTVLGIQNSRLSPFYQSHRYMHEKNYEIVKKRTVLTFYLSFNALRHISQDLSVNLSDNTPFNIFTVNTKLVFNCCIEKFLKIQNYITSFLSTLILIYNSLKKQEN